MIRVGLSTSSVYPLSMEHAFRLARIAGYDGIEVMVTNDERTRDARGLLALSMKYELPILAIHAPVLLLTQFVWGRDPQVKLEKSAELARSVGASTVVVHPPFRWQARYARDFLRIVRHTSRRYGVEISVENMFPWKAGGRSMAAYSPGYDPTLMDCDAMTLDFSHASLSGRDSLELAHSMGARLHHVHLCDGTGASDENRVFDEHLVPGRGAEPVAEVLQYLAAGRWSGSVVAEVNTRKAKTEGERLALLAETLDFARTALGQQCRPRTNHVVVDTVGRLRRGARRALQALRPARG